MRYDQMNLGLWVQTVDYMLLRMKQGFYRSTCGETACNPENMCKQCLVALDGWTKWSEEQKINFYDPAWWYVELSIDGTALL